MRPRGKSPFINLYPWGEKLPGAPGMFTQSPDDDDWLRGIIGVGRFKQYGMLPRCVKCPRGCKMYNAPNAVIICRKQIAEVARRLHCRPTVAEVLEFYGGENVPSRAD